MKLCSKCKKLKNNNCFRFDKRTLTGLQSQCKKCEKDYRKQHSKMYAQKRKEKCSKYGIGLGTLGRYGLKIGLAIYDKFERKCFECGNENDLTIHHLDRNGRNNQEKGLFVNNNLKNLILLCRSCHGRIHGKEHGKNKKAGR